MRLKLKIVLFVTTILICVANISMSQTFTLKDLRDITKEIRSEYTSYNITQHKWKKTDHDKGDCSYSDMYVLENELKTDFAAIVVYSYNVIMFSFDEDHKSIYNSLNREIKANCKVECSKYDKELGQFTSYILNQKVKIYVSIFKDETGTKRYLIYCVAKMDPDNSSLWTNCEKYDNGVWYNKCK